MPVWFFVMAMLALSGYDSSIQQWREEREAKLRAEDGWLSLAGLFWLEDGSNLVGSAAGARVQLPGGFPTEVGVLNRTGNRVRFRPRSEAGVRVNGKSAAEADLRTDKSGSPDIIQIGRLRLYVIERGSKLGVRMKDPEADARVHFRGLRWFPVREDWKVRARFIAQPRKVTLDAQAGDRQQYESPGYVEWSRGGQVLRLTPVLEENQLFFVFRDTTAGKSTYPAARFLYAAMPQDGFVDLDFNKAYNPPCVFTPYATCPLPAPENRLAVPVEAGEMMYAGH